MKGDGLRVTARTFIGLMFIANSDGVRVKQMKVPHLPIKDIHRWAWDMERLGFLTKDRDGMYHVTEKTQSLIDQIEYQMSWTKKVSK